MIIFPPLDCLFSESDEVQGSEEHPVWGQTAQVQIPVRLCDLEPLQASFSSSEEGNRRVSRKIK